MAKQKPTPKKFSYPYFPHLPTRVNYTPGEFTPRNALLPEASYSQTQQGGIGGFGGRSFLDFFLEASGVNSYLGRRQVTRKVRTTTPRAATAFVYGDIDAPVAPPKRPNAVLIPNYGRYPDPRLGVYEAGFKLPPPFDIGISMPQLIKQAQARERDYSQTKTRLTGIDRQIQQAQPSPMETARTLRPKLIEASRQPQAFSGYGVSNTAPVGRLAPAPKAQRQQAQQLFKSPQQQIFQAPLQYRPFMSTTAGVFQKASSFAGNLLNRFTRR